MYCFKKHIELNQEMSSINILDEAWIQKYLDFIEESKEDESMAILLADVLQNFVLSKIGEGKTTNPEKCATLTLKFHDIIFSSFAE